MGRTAGGNLRKELRSKPVIGKKYVETKINWFLSPYTNLRVMQHVSQAGLIIALPDSTTNEARDEIFPPGLVTWSTTR